MPPKFQNKYRIPSARLQSWDYGSNAAYFVTICTKNREHFFGEIVDSVETQCFASLQPTQIGKIAEQEWIKTLELRPDMNLELGEFIVMPNHFHGIMIIGENRYNGRDAMHCVSTGANQFGPQSKNLASIIRGFKSSVTTQAKKLGNAVFGWRPGSTIISSGMLNHLTGFKIISSITHLIGKKINFFIDTSLCQCIDY